MDYEVRTYHGIQVDASSPDGEEKFDDDEWAPARILVEKPEGGPTERMNVTVLYELTVKDQDLVGGFGWGHNGGGTSRAAAAILADALDLGDVDDAGISMVAYPENKTLVELREAFCVEVLSQFRDEWRLGRTAVLRWAHSWFASSGVDVMPALLRKLPKRVEATW